MKKGQIVEGVIERVEFPNRGIITAEEGRQIIVKNAIPGQKVSVLVNKIRKGKCEGRLLEVLEKSPLECKEAGCVHAGICGGCAYQSLPYEEQLSMKAAQVKKLIDAVILPENEPYEFLGIKESPLQKGYRNKMEFSFGDEYKDGPLALGMHKRESFYDIVNVPECQIVDEDFRKVLAATLSYFKEREIPYYHKLRHTGYLRHLLVRKAVRTGEILVVLVTTSWDGALSTKRREAAMPTESEKCETAMPTLSEKCETAMPDELRGGVMPAERCEDMSAKPEKCEAVGRTEWDEEALLVGWKEALLAVQYAGKMTGILHTKNDSVADTITNEGTDILFGQDFFYEELLGLRFRITPISFFQTNSHGTEVL